MSVVDPVVFPELECCTLCEHRCGVNRLAGEVGVCRSGLPVVASATLHPAPPSSYTVFLAGCNFKCLNCQNWSISCYPDIEVAPNAIRAGRELQWILGGSDDGGALGSRGNGDVENEAARREESSRVIDPAALAAACVERLESIEGTLIRADRIFFSGGAADIHLPFVEEVVGEARKLRPETKVNFDTNGFLTEESFDRVLGFADSVTFDIKAFDDEVHRVVTGAPVAPVLRNAELIGAEHPEQLWEYRVLVIPEITDGEVGPLCDFIASIDRSLPVCFLAFRPNYVLEGHPGAGVALMEHCLELAQEAGLANAHWAGQTGLPGSVTPCWDPVIEDAYQSAAASLAGGYAARAGCVTHPRDCAGCEAQCGMRGYVPGRVS